MTASGLLGRTPEVRRVEDLLTRVRTGTSAVLVLLVEPGIGKTSLLRHVTPAPSDIRTLEVVGVESERQLGYAGLHRLLLPHLNRISRLPVPQRAALSA